MKNFIILLQACRLLNIFLGIELLDYKLYICSAFVDIAKRFCQMCIAV